MPHLDGVKPVNSQTTSSTETLESDKPDVTAGVKPVNEQKEETVVMGDGPAPSNAERRAARAAAEKAEEETKATEDTATEENVAEDTEEEVKAEEAHESWEAIEPTGDETTDSVLDLLRESGVDTDKARSLLWEPMQNGDISAIDKDALVEAVGKARANLIMAGVKDVVSRNEAVVKEVKETVNAAAGGEANWNAVTAWAKKGGISEGDLKEYAGMLNKGGKQAEFAAAEIVRAYNDDPKNTSLSAGRKAITPDAGKAEPVKGLSRLEFGIAMDRLYRRGNATESEYKALREQRRAGKKQGL